MLGTVPYWLYKEYGVPWHKSYGTSEGHAWGDQALDVAKILPNAAYDAAKFVADVGIDVGQAGWSRLPTWMGGEGLGSLSTEAKYKLDAHKWNPLPNYYKDNPYSNPEIMKGYEKKAADKAYNYILTPEDEGGFMTKKKADSIWKSVDRQLPWSKYAKENPFGSEEEFNKLQWDLFVDNAFARNEKAIDDYYNTDIDRSLMEDYGIGADKGALDKFDLWDYGMDRNPLFDYSNPTAQTILGHAQLVPELFMGTGLIKHGLRAPKYIKAARSGKGAKEGIMENVKRIEGPGKYDWAEEWLNRRGGR